MVGEGLKGDTAASPLCSTAEFSLLSIPPRFRRQSTSPTEQDRRKALRDERRGVKDGP